VLETKATGEVVDAVEESRDRLLAPHREDHLVFVYKGFEADHNVSNVSNVALAVCGLLELLLGPVLKVEYSELPKCAADRCRDANKRVALKVERGIPEPGLIFPALEIHRH
jgi:hypothetical protein